MPIIVLLFDYCAKTIIIPLSSLLIKCVLHILCNLTTLIIQRQNISVCLNISTQSNDWQQFSSRRDDISIHGFSFNEIIIWYFWLEQNIHTKIYMLLPWCTEYSVTHWYLRKQLLSYILSFKPMFPVVLLEINIHVNISIWFSIFNNYHH
jgi:hypothetical protein